MEYQEHMDYSRDLLDQLTQVGGEIIFNKYSDLKVSRGIISPFRFKAVILLPDNYYMELRERWQIPSFACPIHFKKPFNYHYGKWYQKDRNGYPERNSDVKIRIDDGRFGTNKSHLHYNANNPHYYPPGDDLDVVDGVNFLDERLMETFVEKVIESIREKCDVRKTFGLKLKRAE